MTGCPCGCLSKYPYYADPDCVKFQGQRRWEVIEWDRSRRPVTLGTMLAEIAAIAGTWRRR